MNGRSKAREGENLSTATIIPIIQVVGIILVGLSLLSIVLDKK
jgi:hypothetical protein